MFTFAKRFAVAALSGIVALSVLAPDAQAQRRGGMAAQARPIVQAQRPGGMAAFKMPPQRPPGGVTRPASNPPKKLPPSVRKGEPGKPKPPARDRDRDRDRGEREGRRCRGDRDKCCDRPWCDHRRHHHHDWRNDRPSPGGVSSGTGDSSSSSSSSSSDASGSSGNGGSFGSLPADVILRRERLESRRGAFDDEDERTQSRGSPPAQRNRNRASDSDIVSARALNDLLEQLIAVGEEGFSIPFVALDKSTLEQINVATIKGGNVGLLKNKGQLDWPPAFQGSEFNEERSLLNEVVEEAVKQVTATGRVGHDLLTTMDDGTEELEARLKKQVNRLPPSDYIEAKRFIRHLEDASKALKQPRVAAYINNTYAAKGRTVAQLIKNLAAEGLQFAPATPGSERDYLQRYP